MAVRGKVEVDQTDLTMETDLGGKRKRKRKRKGEEEVRGKEGEGIGTDREEKWERTGEEQRWDATKIFCNLTSR
jgi:hypothetical protein